ncbi:hypothetical protein ABBQ38_012353 [Trebouxia sp. C0009 RCD-2024]
MFRLAGLTTIASYTSLTAHCITAAIKSTIFHILALQLAAVLSAFCLPIMALDAILSLLGLSPLIEGTGEHKDKTSRKTIPLVANSATRPRSNGSKTVSSTKAAAEYGPHPKGYAQVTDHEAGWLAAHYQHLMEFYSPYKVEPMASLSPAYQKKLDLVLSQKIAKQMDLKTLGFAKFVCEQKGLPYTDMHCFHVMTGKFLQLSPPQSLL